MFYRILVVGLDESANRFLQAIKDSMIDATLQMAANVREAIELLNDQSFDMILSGPQLLETEGTSLIRKVAAYKNKPALAIMSSTGRTRTINAFLAVRHQGYPVVGSISSPRDVVDLRNVQVKSLGLRAVARAEQILRQKYGTKAATQVTLGKDLQIRFRPRINLLDGRVVAVEAVMRTEQLSSGLEQALDTLIAVQRCWQQQGYRLPIWIKLPLHLLDCPDYPDQLHKQVLSRGGDPGFIGLDLLKCPERDCLNRYAESIYQLGLNGFALSHDDFGQGYSFYFKLDLRLFTDLKLFLPLLRSAVSNEKLASSLAHIVFESKQLGFTVVAEGVTTREELLLFRQLGCDEAQGTLISDLVDEQGVIDLLAGGGCYSQLNLGI